MSMKRECLISKAIWTAKKRYVLHVWDAEGVRYKEPKLKIKGLEAIKSSVPSICRDKIKEAIKIILTGSQDKLLDFIEQFHKEFKKLPIEDIASPTGIDKIQTYDKNTKFNKGLDEFIDIQKFSVNLEGPMHISGAVLYNAYILHKNMQNEYPLIQNGDKIKYICLKFPNIFNWHVISFPVKAPKEFMLEKYIDYQSQYEKVFLTPLKIILDAIGWKAERESSLEDFF